MTSFRIPVSVKPLLKLSKTNGVGPFPTNAHILVLASSYGFYLCKQGKEEFASGPAIPAGDSIDEYTFRNQGLMDQLLIIAIAHEGSVEVVRDDSSFSSVIQSYAHIGGVHLTELLTRYEGDFLRELADRTHRAVEVHTSKK